MNVVFKDLGEIKYKKAWREQQNLFDVVLQAKEEDKKRKGYLLICEHPHVYTLGKNGILNNLLINNDTLKQINAEYLQVDRGGDITYHGYGQIVGYPIFDLEAMGVSLKNYIYNLEEVIINTLKEYDIETCRLQGATGVWLKSKDGLLQNKICAIGVRASKWVTMHGFALNVNTDLSYFSHINPCGFSDKGVTSIQKELGKSIDMQEVKNKILVHFKKIYDIKLITE